MLCSASPAPVLTFSSKSPQKIPVPSCPRLHWSWAVTSQNVFTVQALSLETTSSKSKEIPFFFLTLEIVKAFRSSLVCMPQTKTLQKKCEGSLGAALVLQRAQIHPGSAQEHQCDELCPCSEHTHPIQGREGPHFPGDLLLRSCLKQFIMFWGGCLPGSKEGG